MGKKNIAYVNNEMLVWARRETPFESVEELTERFPRFSTERIKRWETGEEYPSIREAKDLANVYKLPFACFFLSDIPPKKVRPYTDRRTAYGTEYGKVSYDLWKEIKRVNDDRETLLNYYDKDLLLEYQTLPTVSTNDSINEIASSIRNYLKIPRSFRYKKEYGNNSYNYYRDVLERHGIIVAQISGVSLLEMKGLSIFSEQFPIIAINNKDFERAKTYSLFHEVAHLIRRSSSLCLIDDDERNDDEEKICDRIAAEVLMDHLEFKRIGTEIYANEGSWNNNSLLCLADRFGVSMVAAFRRLHDLNMIGDADYYEMYNDISEEFEKKKEAIEAARAGKDIPFYFHVRYVNSHGHLLPKMIIAAESTGKITLGEACKIMNIKSKYYGDIVKAVMK